VTIGRVCIWSPVFAIAWSRIWMAALVLGFAFAAPSRANGQIPDVIARVKQSVVAIGTYQKTRNPPFIFRGTGFAIADGTLIATNAHVLPETLASESGEVLVIAMPLGGGQIQQREVTRSGVDAEHDLAILKLTGPPLPALGLGDASVREGQTFGFTGFPIGTILGLTPVTHRAMVSAVTPIVLPRTSAKQLDAKAIARLKAGPFAVYQLDAIAYPGNSGSPLYDTDTGRVVAVINMVFVRGSREAALNQPSGIAFAIPIRHLTELLASQR
jgi:serine protease Do